MTKKKSDYLQLDKRSKPAAEVEDAMKRRIVGQDEAVNVVVDAYETFVAGLNPKRRPVANLMFLGPTGTGKTRVVEALAEALFGDSRAVLKVDCAEYQHDHDIAKLVGSPPGYLGHDTTHAMLTQEAINQWFRPGLELGLILFDEIEKAHNSLWRLLLGVLDKAEMTTGANKRVDFSRCMIFMTSNVGAEEMANCVSGGIGFSSRGDSKQFDEAQLSRIAVEAMRRKFSPEFYNRLDGMTVFKTLSRNQLEQIAEIELGAVQQRILASANTEKFVFTCSKDAKARLIDEGYDARYGARHLKRAIEREIVRPMSRLAASGQIKLGDHISVGIDPTGAFAFQRVAAATCGQ